MFKTRANPSELFDQKTLNETYAFIESLSKSDIRRFRDNYTRELNRSNEDNQLPETTLEKRRCFLYLTAQYATQM